MSNLEEEMVSIEIPKSLHDRIDRHAIVERVIVSEMTDWVEIMEDEEKLTEKESSSIKYLIHTYFNTRLPHVIVEGVPGKNLNLDFLGKIKVSSKEMLLRVAESWRILPDEIEFVEDCF